MTDSERKPDSKLGKIKSLRRTRTIQRFRSQFKIYHKSIYGKVGLYILLAFAIIALLAPVLAPQPYSFIAPQIDTHTAKERQQLSLPALHSGEHYFGVMASSTSVIGSILAYYGVSNGTIYANGLGGTPTTGNNTTFEVMHVNVSSNNTMLPPVLASFSNYNTLITVSRLQLENFLIAATSNGTVNVAMVQWTNGSLGAGQPFVKNPNHIKVNGTIVGQPVTNTKELAITVPVYVPFYGTTNPALGSPALIYVVSHNSTGYYLNAMDADPLHIIWVHKLPGTQAPGSPVYYGSFFQYATIGDQARVLISQGNSVYSFSAIKGALVKQVNFTSNVVTTPYVPEGYDYQTSPKNYNAFFIATADNNVYSVNMSNYNRTVVLKTNTTVSAITSSPGSNGFPTYFVVQTTSDVYLTSRFNGTFTTDKLQLPQGFGNYYTQPKYDNSAGTFIFLSSNGLMFSLQGSVGKYPYTWSVELTPKPSNVTEQVTFLDSYTGRVEIGTITSAGYMYIYDATAYDLNPIPPTFHAPSGNVYPLGTNKDGQDIFAQFIQSFVYDWALGISIGIATILIGVIAAMIIGYIGGVTGSVFETISLAVYLIPGLALLIALQGILGGSFVNLLWIVTVVSWPFTAFTLIGVVRQIKARTYVEAAKLSGARVMGILRRHVVPNIAPLTLYLLALSISGGVVAVSTLQFLGLAPLNLSTWGGMLNSVLTNYYYVIRAPWWIFPPTIALTMFVFAFIFVSRGLDEVTNPRLRRR